MVFLNSGLWYIRHLVLDIDDDYNPYDENMQEDRETWNFIVLIAILVALTLIILNIAI